MQSVCHGYMCILQCVKLISCSGFPEIYTELEEVVGQSAMGIRAFFYMSNFFQVIVFQRSILNWRSGCSQSFMGISAFIYISNLFGVVILQRSMLGWRREWSQSVLGICAFLYM